MEAASVDLWPRCPQKRVSVENNHLCAIWFDGIGVALSRRLGFAKRGMIHHGSVGFGESVIWLVGQEVLPASP